MADRKPTLKELQKFLIPHALGIWEELGIELELDEDGSILDKIRRERERNQSKCCLDVVKAWLQGAGVEPKTWGTLLESLGAISGGEGAITSIQENILNDCKKEDSDAACSKSSTDTSTAETSSTSNPEAYVPAGHEAVPTSTPQYPSIENSLPPTAALELQQSKGESDEQCKGLVQSETTDPHLTSSLIGTPMESVDTVVQPLQPDPLQTADPALPPESSEESEMARDHDQESHIRDGLLLEIAGIPQPEIPPVSQPEIPPVPQPEIPPVPQPEIPPVPQPEIPESTISMEETEEAKRRREHLEVPVTVDAPKTAPISGGSDSGPNRPEPAPKPAEPLREPTPASTEISIKDLDFVKKIGEGGSGQVWEGTYLSKPVAIKQMVGSPLTEREVDIISELRHINIVKFHGVARPQRSLYIVTELAKKGSLYHFMKREDNRGDPYLPRSLFWARGIADGVCYLHDFNYIHRDLKSGNILLTDCDDGAPFWTAKICDLGSAREDGGAVTMRACLTGTIQWMPPEALGSQNPISKAWDVYSYGMVVWELLTHKVPFEDVPDVLLPNKIINGLRPEIPDCHHRLADLMTNCWKKNRTERPLIQDIVPELSQIEDIVLRS